EISGRDISLVIPDFSTCITPVRPEEVAGGSERAFRTLQETIGCRKDGFCFPVQISISSLQREGRLSHVAIIQDISERKQAAASLAEQKEFAESLVRNSAVPAFVIDVNRRVLIWNRACEELTGVKAEEMLGSDQVWKVFYGTKKSVLAEIIIDGLPDQMPDYFQEFGKSSYIPEGLQAEGWYPGLNGSARY